MSRGRPTKRGAGSRGRGRRPTPFEREKIAEERKSSNPTKGDNINILIHATSLTPLTTAEIAKARQAMMEHQVNTTSKILASHSNLIYNNLKLK